VGAEHRGNGSEGTEARRRYRLEVDSKSSGKYALAATGIISTSSSAADLSWRQYLPSLG
jgi:hypothetical protein